MTGKTYQQRVSEWVTACLPPSARSNQAVRTHRFLEEALELVQANGCSHEEAIALVDYVFARPAGCAVMETGGVIITLAALSTATGTDMVEAGEKELARNWSRIDAIRRKQASKPEGSPLPQ